MRNLILATMMTVFIGSTVFAQVGIGTTSPQAALDVSSTTQGALFPRMTTAQKNAISSPATSSLVFDTDLGEYFFYDGTTWVPLVPKASTKIFQVLSKTANQSISSVPADITWNAIAGQGTALTYSGATVTLPPNKTFLITGFVAIATATSSYWTTYQVQDNNNSTTPFVLSTRGFMEASTEGANDSPGGPAVAMINTGSSSKQIKLRVILKQSGTLLTTSNADTYAETILLIQEL